MTPFQATGQIPLSDDQLAPDLRHRGSFAMVFVVAIGIGVSMLDVSGLRWPPALLVLAIAGLYIVLFLKISDRAAASGERLALAAYFTVQIGLVAALSAIFAWHRVFGVEWIILMPLVSQSRIYLRPWGTALVSLAGMAVMAAHVYSLSGWRHLPGSLAGVSTAIVFVLLFTDIAVSEGKARAESQRLSDELAGANRKLADYAVQAEELATVRERSRVAREIHDSLGHSLSALNMQLEAARAVFDHRPEKTLDALDKARDLARQGLGEIRQSVAALTTSPLEGRSLDDALARLATQNAEAGIPTRLRVEGESRPLGPRADLTLYRTVQEGLTNVRKHSRARRVDVVLDYSSPETARLAITDDGVGSDDPRDGFGLLGVRERVRQIDGRLRITTRPGHGLTLEVKIPA